jgi:hypothetical protein
MLCMWGQVFVQSRPSETSLQRMQTTDMQKFLRARTTEKSVFQLQRSRYVINHPSLFPYCVSFAPQAFANMARKGADANYARKEFGQ